MIKKFKFTNAKIKALASHDPASRSSELEFSDDGEVSGLRLLVGKSGSKRFLLRYTFQSKKKSISIVKFGDIDAAQARKYKAQIADGIDHKAEKDSYKTIPTV